MLSTKKSPHHSLDSLVDQQSYEDLSRKLLNGQASDETQMDIEIQLEVDMDPDGVVTDMDIAR